MSANVGAALWIARTTEADPQASLLSTFPMQSNSDTLTAGRERLPRAALVGDFMLQTLRQLYDQGLHSAAVGRALALLSASPLIGKLVRNREAVSDAAGWCGWVLAGGVVLFASWELGGFGVLVGEEPHQEPPGPPAVRQPARTAPAEAQAEGCTQASLNRATGTTTAANCQQALRSR
jgi:hypothetical protein